MTWLVNRTSSHKKCYGQMTLDRRSRFTLVSLRYTYLK